MNSLSRNQVYHKERKRRTKWQQIKQIFKEKFGGGDKEDPEFAQVDRFHIKTSRYNALDKVGRLSNFEVDFLLQLTFQSLPTSGPTLAFASTEFYSKIITLRKLFGNPQTETDLSDDDFILKGILHFI